MTIQLGMKEVAPAPVSVHPGDNATAKGIAGSAIEHAPNPASTAARGLDWLSRMAVKYR